MNKLLLSASALVLGLTIANQASADCNGLYLAARGGVVKHKFEAPKEGQDGNSKNFFNKKKFMASAAIGYRYNYFRGELEYVWRDPNKKHTSVTTPISIDSDLKFKSYSYMLNGYIDLAPYSWLTPYVGAGVGFTKHKITENTLIGGETQDDNWHTSKTNFTWSVGGGLSVKVTNRFNVDAGYRYYDMGKIKGSEGHKNDLTAQEVYGGIRYVF